MEELYNLVKIRNEFKSLLIKENRYSGYEKAINRLSANLIPSEISTILSNNLEKINSVHDELEKYINDQIKIFENKIEEKIKDFSKNNYTLPPFRDIKESTEFSCILGEEGETKRQLELDEELLEIIRTIIGTYSDWKFPSLEIGCGRGDMTIHMKSADPLYVTDVSQDFLFSTKNQFNEIYKKRIRAYLQKRENFTEFNYLPQNQFKFILAWNVFNYYPEHELKEILKSCWDLLRPGGDIMFSYNDCEYLPCVTKFAYGSGSWITEKSVIKILTDLGYEINSIVHADGEVHWVEACKAGELGSVKVHPSIGKIHLLN